MAKTSARLFGYVIAILIGLALPQVAAALYFGIAVYLVVPFRGFARLLSVWVHEPASA